MGNLSIFDQNKRNESHWEKETCKQINAVEYLAIIMCRVTIVGDSVCTQLGVFEKKKKMENNGFVRDVIEIYLCVFLNCIRFYHIFFMLELACTRHFSVNNIADLCHLHHTHDALLWHYCYSSIDLVR